MTKLSWNVLGWIYQDGITHLRGTFDAATGGISRRAEDAYRAVEEYDANIEAGAQRQVERTDEGDIISDYRDILLHHPEAAEGVNCALHKAYTIAILHHWKRLARDWTSRERGGFHKLMAIEERGYLAEIEAGTPADVREYAKRTYGIA